MFLQLHKLLHGLKSQQSFLHVLKHAKPQKIALLASENGELINVIVERAINTLSGNHILTKLEKNKLNKHKNIIPALITPKINIILKYLILHGGFIVHGLYVFLRL